MGNHESVWVSISKFFLIFLLIMCVFCLVYVRSSVVSLEYGLGELQSIKAERLKEQKMLLAEKTSLLSFGKLESALKEKDGFTMPDRIKVIHVDERRHHMPYRVSLQRGHLAEP
ncbi:MAG: hypothetical protein AB1390_02320 [Nitrospirota bacterium]